MNILQALWLGVLQGVTEFLPISSSGHLVLGKAILGVHTEGVAYEVFVHFGTFLAILTIFWKDVWHIAKAVGHAVRHPSPGKLSLRYQEDPFFRVGILICIGTIPILVVGLFLEHEIEAVFSSPLFVSVALLVTGSFLLGTRWIKSQDTRFGMLRAFVIGLAQAFAILPGISRSGSTIAAGMYAGVERSEAARFSFLLVLPAILGATVLKGAELLHTGIPSQQIMTLFVGTIAAYISGTIALKWLLGVIRRGRLDRFGYYCYALGIVGIIWFAQGFLL
ncbi:MAG: undecaprenyl-diphosphate phosphatase [Deltaproteobacteria bacterium]|nr:undecaprenyl-diphosphate phosphatase [Deltaproteobacteria bacterium]